LDSEILRLRYLIAVFKRIVLELGDERSVREIVARALFAFAGGPFEQALESGAVTSTSIAVVLGDEKRLQHWAVWKLLIGRATGFSCRAS